METSAAGLVARHRHLIAVALIAVVAAALLFGLWWLSMADASMTGCGGG